MTTDCSMTATPPAPARVAHSTSVCGAVGCRRPIEPGQLITKPPGRAWRHADCEDPYRGRKRVRRDAEG